MKTMRTNATIGSNRIATFLLPMRPHIVGQNLSFSLERMRSFLKDLHIYYRSFNFKPKVILNFGCNYDTLLTPMYLRCRCIVQIWREINIPIVSIYVIAPKFLLFTWAVDKLIGPNPITTQNRLGQDLRFLRK